VQVSPATSSAGITTPPEVPGAPGMAPVSVPAKAENVVRAAPKS